MVRILLAVGAALIVVVVILALGTHADRQHQSLPASVGPPTGKG